MKLDRDRQFSEYVSARRASLLRTARLVCAGDGHKAEDVVQNALIRLYLVWPKIRDETLDAYARRCVVNAAIDDHRRLYRRREQSRSEVPDTPAPQHVSGEHSVFGLLATLPPGMRAAVVLRYVEGLSVAEVADAVGCSQGTVKSQSARGLARLRDVLDIAHVLSPVS